MSTEFTKPMHWENEGIEPSPTLKTVGFQAGYKPPASIFNYMLNNIETCTTELQTATNDLETVTAELQTTTNDLETATENLQTATNSLETGKADAVHTHAISDVTNLAASLTSINNAVSGKANNADLNALSSTVNSMAVSLGEQIDTKADINHTHNYAGSSTAGGAATSADKLNTDAGSTTVPVYFSGGIPKVCSYTLGAACARGVSTTPTSGSTSLITSGAVYTALAGKAALSHTHAMSDVDGLSDNLTTINTTLGYTAKNLYNWVSATLQKSGSITYSKTDTGITVTATGTWASAAYTFPVKSGKTYIFSCKISSLVCNSTNTVRIRLAYDTGGSSLIKDIYLNSTGNYEVTFTPTSDTAYILFYPNYSSTSYANSFTATELMLRYSTITDSTYEPYVGNVYTRLGDIRCFKGTGTYAAVLNKLYDGTSGNKAAGDYSLSTGYNNVANAFQLVSGRYSTAASGPTSETDTTGSLFIVGNGGSTSSNAFRVQTNGACYGKGSYYSSGADYAEYWELEDGNPNNEDLRGFFVTVNENNKILKANANDDYILGVISATPVVTGDAQSEEWKDKYLKDVYGCPITEEKEVDGVKSVEYVLNPEYDASKEYTNRENRKEWQMVGLLGKLVVNDDGTCKAGEYCKVADGGIATASTSNKDYRVLERIDDSHIRILFR